MTLSSLAVALALATTAPSSSTAPWEQGPAFAADPKAVAAALAQRPAPEKEAPTELLLEELEVSYDANGLATRTVRYVYVLRSAAAARDWRVAYAYSPWYESRPDVRARVISPAGEARWLDGATLADGPEERNTQEGAVYHDRRVVQAPLPAIQVGAIVEEVGVTRQHAPFFTAGDVTAFYAARKQPVARFRVRVDAPASLHLVHRAVGLPAAKAEVANGRRVLRWDVAALAPAEEPEPLSPPEDVRFRGVYVATGRSWREVAGAYAALVDRQLAGADLAGLAREIIAPGDSAEIAATKVLDWISARIRYTGLSLGEAAIVPARPGETLARRFGDCKDLSTLAVGLLRAAGHRASVALLATGVAEIDPDLPGLGAFDHAIVRVDGKAPLWLDPTFAGSAPGELPAGAQARLALVAAADTSGLVRTPETRPGADRVRKVRTITLPEEGWAQSSEEGEFWGAPAVNVFAVTPELSGPAGVGRAKERLNAPDAKHPSLRVEPRTGGRAGVARLRMEADASKWARVDEKATVLVAPHPVFARLPPPFSTDAVDERPTPPPQRRHALVLPEPYVAELRYRVVPPPGFRAGALPPAERVQLGPARFESAFTVERDGTIAVTYRFETGRRRLTPAEVDALWRGVEERTHEDGPRIELVRESDALLAEGRGREAIAAIRRLVELHPKEARHHEDLSRALLRLGLGLPAREAARRAVALEPDDAWAHVVLADALEHDAAGRQLAAGCELAGAIAELRKAVELEPAAAQYRAHLGFVLEHGAGCARFAPGARLDEAAAALRRARDDAKGGKYDADLLIALVRGGRFAEAAKLARAMPAAASRNAALLASVAIAEGVESAVRESQRLSSDARVEAVRGAAFELLTAREYVTAGAFLNGAAAGTSAAADLRAFGARVASVRRLDRIRVDTKDPASVPVRFMLALAADDPRGALGKLLVARHRAEAAAFPEADAIRALLVKQSGGFPLPTAFDIGTSFLTVRVDGQGPWRVRATLTVGGGDRALTFLAAREDGELRVADVMPGAQELAAEALRRVEAGDLAAARTLLGWAREADDGARRTDLAAIWPSGERAGRDELERAAALLAAGRASAEALPVLLRERDKAAGTARDALSLALVVAAADAAEPGRALDLVDAFAREEPKSEAFCRDAKLRVLRRAGRHADIRRLAEARLGAKPDDSGALRELAFAAGDLGDYAGAAAALRRLAKRSDATATDLNNAAWGDLFLPAIGPDALELARRAAEKEPEYAALHTLATLHAALDQPAEAIEVLGKALEARGGPLAPTDHLVLGRVAQAYGLEDAAAESYRAAAAQNDPDPTSTTALAKRWLATLPRAESQAR